MLIAYLPWLAAMGVLILASAFFSSSEAAWFSLPQKDQLALRKGNRAQRMAAALLDDPDRLLTAVLFWNLAVNLTYFAMVSIASLRLESEGHGATAGTLAVGSLLVMILLSEMLPKSVGVLIPRPLVALHAVPLAALVRVLDPILPWLRAANVVSLRLIWPRFEPEPYLRVGDLERAVELSTTTDASLLKQEQQILQSIVLLSEIRADELMRPRTRFRCFQPPVALADLEGWLPPSGYLLVSETDTDEVASAIDLKSLSNLPTEHLEHHAEPVVYVPWCATVADALEAMRADDRQVAVVVNELGETIGMFTFDDILDTIFSQKRSRSERLLKRAPIRQAGPGVWHVTGMTSLWRLARHFGMKRPQAKSVTVAGIVQEALGRLPERGDRCRWGPFEMVVLAAPERGQIVVELTLVQPEETGS
ncbi:MAG: DUF21 domain-containing protein [Pirellulales bacterium]|nr:DUF21 domain-containing protein [Pirellulales bacterium]